MEIFFEPTGENKHIAEAIRRLCHFVPQSGGKNLCSAIHEHLVEHAIANLGSKPHSASDIRHSLKQLFNLDFEEEEVKNVIEKLMMKDVVLSPSRDVYCLNTNEHYKLAKSLKDIEELEQNNITEWVEKISRKYPDLGEEDLKELKEDLVIYLTKIFARHGAECVALIYAGQEDANIFIDKLKDDVSFLPNRLYRLHNIRIIELPDFFKNPSIEKKLFIARLLDSTFLIHMLHIDKNCSALVQQQFKDCKLYLDTNFIYRLLGLNGLKLKNATKKTVEIAKNLGFSLIVSSRTVQEWQSSIDRAVKDIRNGPRIPPELAKVGADYTTEEDFKTAYWREFAKTKISINDFFSLYRRIEDLLKEHEIKISDTLCDKIKENHELNEEISKLNIATGYVKHPEVAEHDAFHRLLIMKLRGKTAPTTFVDAKAWFLTCDTLLPIYDRIARKSAEGVPFCMLANHWIQTMRPLLPRSEDFDETFVDLFNSPYLRTYGNLPSDVAHIILGRISRFKEHSPELATRVLTDSYLTQELRRTTDEDKINELIDNTMAKVAEEFRRELEEVKKQLENTKIEKGEVEKEKTEETKLLKKDFDDERKAREKLEKKMNWLQASFVWVFTLGIAVILPWKNSHLLVKLLFIVALTLIAFFALSFPIGKTKTVKIIGYIDTFISLLLFIYFLIDKLE